MLHSPIRTCVLIQSILGRAEEYLYMLENICIENDTAAGRKCYSKGLNNEYTNLYFFYLVLTIVKSHL